MNTIKITLAALAIAASATSAFAFDNTSGQGNRVTNEIPAATGDFEFSGQSAGSVAQPALDAQVDFNRVHENGPAN